MNNFCVPKGRLSDPTYESQVCYAQNVTGVGWDMVSHEIQIRVSWGG